MRNLLILFFLMLILIQCDDYTDKDYSVQPEDIKIMDSDGTSTQIITQGKDPSFSPDGRKIVFLRKDSEQGDYSIYIRDLVSGNETELLENLYYPSLPSFSPDGNKILFYLAHFKIYQMNIDGSNLTFLENGNTPSFSPDGSKIILTRYGYVYVMDADGNNLHKLTNSSKMDSYPAYSPDGQKIIFNRKWFIYIMDQDGSNLILITQGYNPRFSTDGTKFTYSNNGQIYTMNTDGSNQQKLSDDEYPNGKPRFSLDNSKIIFYTDYFWSNR